MKEVINIKYSDNGGQMRLTPKYTAKNRSYTNFDW